MTIIRKANINDVDILENLFQLVRKKTFLSVSPDQFKIGDYEKSVEGEDVWVAEKNGNIVGFISIWMPDNFIHNLFVHPDYQGCGIGTQLLLKAEECLLRPMWNCPR